MKNEKISIIVPIYNGEKYIESLIQCINNQEYKNYELILINDGSKDKTDKICIELSKKNKKIKYIKKENTGVSDTRNYGISVATGKYICFIDVDDMISNSYLKDFINIKEDNSNTLYCCEYQKFTSKTEEIKVKPNDKIKEYKDKKKYDILYNSKYLGYLWNKFFSREIIEKNNIRFKEDIYMMEDSIFVSDYLKYINRVICIPNKNYYYRISEQSSSKKLCNTKWFSILKALDILKYSKDNYTAETYNKIIYSYLYYIQEAKFRLKYIKNNENYLEYKEMIKKRIKDIKKMYKYLSLKQKTKILLYNYFNKILFNYKKRR